MLRDGGFICSEGEGRKVKRMGSRVHRVDKERREIGEGGGSGRFHRNSGRMGAPSNATILRLAGLDKHRWDNGRLKQLVALETPNGHSLDLATLPYAIAACRKAYGSVFSSDRRGFDGSWEDIYVFHGSFLFSAITRFIQFLWSIIQPRLLLLGSTRSSNLSLETKSNCFV